MTKRGFFLAAIASIFLLPGCAQEENSDPPGRAEPARPDVDLELVYGEGRVSFGNITDLFVTDSSILVADGMNRQVIRFDLTTGELLETIGRAGLGPGEFRYPLAASGNDRNVYVFDQQAGQVSWFQAGELRDSWPVDRQPRYGQRSEATLTDDGSLFIVGYEGFQEGLMARLGSRRQGITRGSNSILMWDADETSWRELVEVAGVEVFADVSRGLLVDVAFPRRPLWTPTRDGDGVWVADNGDTRATLYSETGNRLESIQTSFPRYPVPEAERTRYLNAADLDSEDENAVREARARRASLPFPDSMPALLSLLPGPGRDLWVVGRTSLSDKRLRRVDTTGVTEDYLLPQEFRVHAVRKPYLYGVLTDSLGVQVPAKYQLPHQ